jgi:hypothetical protein
VCPTHLLTSVGKEMKRDELCGRVVKITEALVDRNCMVPIATCSDSLFSELNG